MPKETENENENEYGGRGAVLADVAPVTTPLTQQEHRVADLAAGGLTNKEIGRRMHLSPRTVGSHLYRVFPKLGITSRAALRDALNRTTTVGARQQVPHPRKDRT